MKHYFLFILMFSVLPTCEAQKKTSKKQSKPSISKPNTNIKTMENIYVLKEGETKFFPELETNITFKSVKEDSRCPKGTSCIWEGVGVVDIELMGIYTRPQTFTIATNNLPDKGYNNKIEFNNLSVQLKELNPEPSQKKSSKELKGSYKIGLIITKSE